MECDNMDDLLEILDDRSDEVIKASFVRDALVIIIKEFKTLEADYISLENYCSDLEIETETRCNLIQEQINDLNQLSRHLMAKSCNN